jgi:hypothetical protein
MARITELEYIFKQILPRGAAYYSIVPERREIFDHKVGEALEVVYPDRADEFLNEKYMKQPPHLIFKERMMFCMPAFLA